MARKTRRDRELEEQADRLKKEADANSDVLSRMWSHAARGTLTAIREGREVELKDVEDLQGSLEAIETRQTLAHLRELTT
jgi:hypothetical protein